MSFRTIHEMNVAVSELHPVERWHLFNYDYPEGIFKLSDAIRDKHGVQAQ